MLSFWKDCLQINVFKHLIIFQAFLKKSEISKPMRMISTVSIFKKVTNLIYCL